MWMRQRSAYITALLVACLLGMGLFSGPSPVCPQTGMDVQIPSEDSARTLARGWLNRSTGDRQTDSTYMEQFKIAYLRGCSEAISDIQHKRPRICTLGLKPRMGMDDSTGLFYDAIGGCVITAEIDGYQRGYNGIIEKWLAEHGIPEWSRKAWVPILKSPREFFQSCSLTSGATRIEPVGTTATSPNGLWRLVVRDSTYPDQPENKALYHLRFVEITDSNGESWQSERLWLGPAYASELVWGEKGSDAIGIHWWANILRPFHSDSTHLEQYLTVDLRSGRIIASEDVEP